MANLSHNQCRRPTSCSSSSDRTESGLSRSSVKNLAALRRICALADATRVLHLRTEQSRMNAKILMIASAFVIFMLGIGSVSAQNAPPPPDAAAATAPAEAAPPAAGAPAPA